MSGFRVALNWVLGALGMLVGGTFASAALGHLMSQYQFRDVLIGGLGFTALGLAGVWTTIQLLRKE